MLAEPIPLTARLRRKIEADFATADRAAVIHALERVDLGDWLSTRPPAGRERVLGSVLVMARGQPGRLADAVAHAERDWRDALVWGGLAQPDWPDRLDAFLGRSDDGHPGHES
jgi:hypothetical protein